jgi:hypothetical protein
MINNIINIERPVFIYLSGSSVLNYILKNNDIETNWRPSDIDIYIDFSHESFTLIKALDYIKNIHLWFSNNSNNQKTYVTNQMTSISDSISKVFAKYYKNKLKKEFGQRVNDFYNEEGYSFIGNIVDVLTYSFDSLKLDFVMINIDIETFINTHFDLSIVKNYIDNNNKIVNLNNLQDSTPFLKFKIAEYDLQVLRLRFTQNTQRSCITFITRITKYINRGIKIYLKFKKCDCNDINCLCSIYLDSHFINVFNQD